MHRCHCLARDDVSLVSDAGDETTDRALCSRSPIGRSCVCKREPLPVTERNVDGSKTATPSYYSSDSGGFSSEGSEFSPARVTYLRLNAATIDLSTKMSTRDASKMIGLACLKQVVDNVPALIKGDPEGVHQMRVGVRRLRAAMSLFAGLLA